MSRNEFYEIIKNERLDTYPIGDSKRIAITPYIVGCAHINGNWCVYENDERGNQIFYLDIKLKNRDLIVF